MIPVTQTRLWRPADHPLGPSSGNCMAACVASIFEVPITQATDATGVGLIDWTREQYPGLSVDAKLVRPLPRGDESLDDWKTWPPLGSIYNPGFWIACAYSYRVPDQLVTGCECRDMGGEGDPDCEWCWGRPDERVLGVLWGLHAVVMCGRDVVWDPHPRRTDGVGPIADTFTWRVVDPARL